MQKKFEIILADPAWSYRAWGKKGIKGTAESHYPTMKVEDICALPVADISAKNSVLFYGLLSQIYRKH